MKKLLTYFGVLFFLCLAFGTSEFLLADEPLWNQFRGPNHDNHAFSTGIAKSWPKEGPKLLWKIDDIGGGYSNISFDKDTMYTLGDVGNDCLLIALDKATGKKKWTCSVGKSGSIGNYPGPRATPAVEDNRVYAFGQYGDFVCVNSKDGKEVWGGDVVNDLGGKWMNNWGFSASPILDDNMILLPVGGAGGTLVAFQKNGKRAWRSSGVTDDAPYSSIVPAEFFGVKQYLLFTGSGIYGIDAKNGKTLWHGVRNTDKPVCSDPVYKDDVVLVSSAYKMGDNGFRVTKTGNKFSAEQIYADESLQNHHGGMVLVGDHVYFTTNQKLHCLDIKTGKVVWEDKCVGKGSLTYVDGFLIVRAEGGDGTVVLVEATPDGYKECGRFAQPDRSDRNSWTYPVIVDGKLYLRDQNVLLCYDLVN
ncbi:MAG: PQQ-binding-like beta-propeller repeat protein [Thermoguttaceae bacterium]